MSRKLKANNLIKLVQIGLNLSREEERGIVKEVLQSFLVELKDSFDDDNLKLQIEEPSKNVYGFFLYRLYNKLYYRYCSNSDAILKIEKAYQNFNESTLFIHPSVLIGANINILFSNKVYLANHVQIGDNCSIGSFVKIGNKNNAPRLQNNVIVKDGVSIYGNIAIGNEVVINENCYITEPIEEKSQVSVVNQLQVTENSIKNMKNAQKFVIYGVVPKFKNTLVLEGEGFYNPIISFKNSSSNLDFAITYWDKNKIILKFKNTKPIKDAGKVIMTVYCNKTKSAIIHSNGVEKCLTSLTN